LFGGTVVAETVVVVEALIELGHPVDRAGMMSLE
jgi:hypothetical protein